MARASANLSSWYCGSPALFRARGGDGDRWNQALQRPLLPAQQSDGSWQPISVHAGDDEGDRSYTTPLLNASLPAGR